MSSKKDAMKKKWKTCIWVKGLTMAIEWLLP